ncbi:TPR-like protein [Stipitochalara longipes BDJ]|nr:TPR-like protein [Stipitochalara longipes BDJ]
MENFLVPIRRGPSYHRDDLLSEVERVLVARGHVVICGKGGTGKTHLAFDFCSKYKTAHPDALIIWIGVETKPYLEERLREIAGHLSIFDQTNMSANIASWLRSHSSDDWILVLDDATKDFQSQYDGTEDAVLPPSSTLIFRCLQENKNTVEENLTYTLRSEEARVVVPLSTLNDSIQILKLHCRSTPWDARIAQQVVTTLEFSPLAISIAGAYMEDGGLTLLEYLEAFQHSDPDYTPSNFFTPVGRTLMLSLRQLESERPQALNICKFMAVLDRQSVVESLLLFDRKRQNARNLYGSLRKLESLSLIHKTVGDYHYSMHRLVRDFFLEHLKNEGKLEEQQQSATELLSNRYPYGDQCFWTVCRIYNPHAQKIIEYKGADVWPRVTLLRSMASYHQNLGDSEAAYTWYMELRKIYASKAPLSTKQNDLMPQLIHARSLQAWFCSWQGQHAESERLWKQCLQENNKIHYETHVDSLIFQSNVATALISQEKYAEAEVLLTQNLKDRIFVRGNEHPDTIQTQQILACAYQDQGKFAKAEELNQKLLDLSSRVQGPEHPDTLTIINNLSMNLSALGRYSEAEVMQWRLLASNERQFGSEHEQVVLSRINLAVTLDKLGMYPTAEEQNRLALAAQKKLFPSDTHPRTMNIENSLGLVLLRQAKYKQAEPILKDILRKRQDILGLDHNDTLISQNNLGGLLMKQQKYGESIAVFRETLERARSKNREEHPDVFTSQYNLAHLLHDMERCTEARPLYEKALAGLRRKLGEGHPVTVECEANFDICRGQGFKLEGL